MKIAIHHRQGSFSDRWIEYCKTNNIEYKIVSAFDSDIIEQLKDCDIFMWHHHQSHYKDVLVAKKILAALEHANIKVFPDFKTGWHFDDKIAQKYLFEALDVPLVKSYVYYDKAEAITWAKNTSYPKVFKLKGGASSANVKLVNNRKEALNLINKAFGKGFPQFDRIGNFKERLYKFRTGKDNLLGILKGIYRLFFIPSFSKLQPPEKGYVYFQDFIPKNNCDVRVIVIGEKAFAIKRLVRKNDFRASGSGNIVYEPIQIDKKFIKLAFDVNSKIDSTSIAFDFIVNENNEPRIVEISYGYAIEAYDDCPGYWDSNLIWHEGRFNPQQWILKVMLTK